MKAELHIRLIKASRRTAISCSLYCLSLFCVHRVNNIMSKNKDKPKAIQPWDRRPWPARGDNSMDSVYAAVGRALSQWERYEGHLALLFSAFVTGMETDIARRAYCAVRTFEGRAEMLRAASEAYFYTFPNLTLQEKFKTVIRDAKSYSPRRNDIAHGVLDHWEPYPVTLPRTIGETWALFPSAANFRDRAFVQNAPEYCYTSAELLYFYQKFNDIAGPPSEVIAYVLRAAHTRS
jgi:hypothetical protein